MLFGAKLDQAAQLITDTDRALSELGKALKATRAQLEASREVTGLVPRLKGLGDDVSQIPALADLQDEV